MNRAERRRQQKTLKNDPVLNIKRSELEQKLAESYQKGYEKGQKTAVREIFYTLIGIPCKILYERFGWGSRKRLPEFADAIIEEYTSFENSDLTIDELQEFIFEKCGVKFVDE